MKFKDSSFYHFFQKFGKYHYTILVFLVVMLYWDDNNLFLRFSLSNKIRQLQQEIEHYETIIDESTKQLDQLRTDEKNLEKFARENYLMKKKEEDIFIVEEQKEETE